MKIDEEFKNRHQYGQKLENMWRLRHLMEDSMPDNAYLVNIDALLVDYYGNSIAVIEIKADRNEITSSQIVLYNKIKKESNCPIYIIEPTDETCDKFKVFGYPESGGDPIDREVNLRLVDEFNWSEWSKFESDLRQASKN